MKPCALSRLDMRPYLVRFSPGRIMQALLVSNRPLVSGDPAQRRAGASRITWEIEPVGASCHLTVTHDQFREGANDQLNEGWPINLSGLLTWLETGEVLTTPGWLR